MFKLAFSVIFVAAIYQAFVCSSPAPKKQTGLAKRLYALSDANSDVLQNVGGSESTFAARGLSPAAVSLGRRFIVKTLMMVMGSDQTVHTDDKNTEDHHLSAEEIKHFRVVSSAVEGVIAQLTTMEAASDLSVQTVRECINQTLGRELEKRDLVSVFDSLNKNFQADGRVRDLYAKLHAKYEQEIPLPTPKDPDSPEEEVAIEKNKKFVQSLMNFAFHYYAYNRLSVTRKHFLLTRSVLELAKKSDQVQAIFDESQHRAVEFLETKSKDYIKNKLVVDWLEKLKVSLEQHSSLHDELKAVEKDVSHRKDWDRSVFDMPV